MKKNWFVGIVGAVFLLLPTYAHAEHNASAPAQDIVHIEQYDAVAPSDEELDSAFNQFVDNKTLTFDVARAQKSGASEQIIEVGTIYNSYLKEFEECEKRQQESGNEEFDLACLPIAERWNWCGKCRTNGGAPQNSADGACMDHDSCLSAGRSVCECDRKFVDRLNAVKRGYRWLDRAYIEAAIRVVPASHGC